MNPSFHGRNYVVCTCSRKKWDLVSVPISACTSKTSPHRLRHHRDIEISRCLLHWLITLIEDIIGWFWKCQSWKGFEKTNFQFRLKILCRTLERWSWRAVILFFICFFQCYLLFAPEHKNVKVSKTQSGIIVLQEDPNKLTKPCSWIQQSTDWLTRRHHLTFSWEEMLMKKKLYVLHMHSQYKL